MNENLDTGPQSKMFKESLGQPPIEASEENTDPIVEELYKLHCQDFTGMSEDEKADFLGHLNQLAKSPGTPIGAAAQKFLAEQKSIN